MSETSRETSCRAGRLRRRLMPLVVLGGALAVVAEEVVVKVLAVQIQPRPTGMGKPVDVVSQNDHLTILSREGTWLKVRTPGGKEGYVKEGALAFKATSAGDHKVSGDASSAGLNATLAGKGLEPVAQKFGASGNINPVPLEQLIGQRNDITADEADQFQKAGAVGPYKAR